MRVANDCHTAKLVLNLSILNFIYYFERYCNDDDGGFEEINCPDGEIVYVDMATFSWSCDVVSVNILNFDFLRSKMILG